MRPPQETKDNIIAILHSKDLIMLDPDDQTPIRVAVELCARKLEKARASPIHVVARHTCVRVVAG
jgi:CBS domain containing-hemolysin-like protein